MNELSLPVVEVVLFALEVVKVLCIPEHLGNAGTVICHIQ
jgi:hypothetical protein